MEPPQMKSVSPKKIIGRRLNKAIKGSDYYKAVVGAAHGDFKPGFKAAQDIAEVAVDKAAGEGLYAPMGSFPATKFVAKKLWNPSLVKSIEEGTGLVPLDYVHNWKQVFRPDKIAKAYVNMWDNRAKKVWKGIKWFGHEIGL